MGLPLTMASLLTFLAQTFGGRSVREEVRDKDVGREFGSNHRLTGQDETLETAPPGNGTLRVDRENVNRFG